MYIEGYGWKCITFAPGEKAQHEMNSVNNLFPYSSGGLNLMVLTFADIAG